MNAEGSSGDLELPDEVSEENYAGATTLSMEKCAWRYVRVRLRASDSESAYCAGERFDCRSTRRRRWSMTSSRQEPLLDLRRVGRGRSQFPIYSNDEFHVHPGRWQPKGQVLVFVNPGQAQS